MTTMRAFLVVALLAVGTDGFADIITLDAADYPLGTDLSEVIPDLTVRRVQVPHEPAIRPALTEERRGSGEPILGLGYGIGDVFQGGRPPWDVLEFDFGPNGVNYVEFEGGYTIDAPGIIAYDSSGNIVATCLPDSLGGSAGGRPDGCLVTRILELTPSGGPNWWGATIVVAREEADIARVVFGGFSASAVAYRITYGVPEPSTLALVGVGLIGAGTRRGRARSSPGPGFRTVRADGDQAHGSDHKSATPVG